MRLANKIEELRTAGFRIGYADPAGAYERGHLGPFDVRDYPQPGMVPVVELSGIAASEDRFGQSTTLQRSNFRRLREDFGDALLPLSYSNTDVLVLFPASVSAHLIDTVIGLAVDYPLYDEMDMSDLESEEIGEAFDAYLWSDSQCDLSEEWQDVADLFETAEIREAFHFAMSTDGYYPEHDGLDIRWDDAQVTRLLETALTALAGTLAPPAQVETLI